MKGLFEKGSIDNEAMKSRDKKRSMFVKVITLLEIVSKKELGIDVDKILAGQEADKTNLMLQIVGRLAGKQEVVANNTKMVKATLKKLKEGDVGTTDVKQEKKPEKKAEKKPERDDKKSRRERSKPAEAAPAPPAQPEEPAAPQPKQRRPPSANVSRRREAMLQQQAAAESDEVEIDDGDGEGGMPAEGATEGRPMTSRGARPVTAGRGNQSSDPFLVQTRIMDEDANALGADGQPQVDALRLIDDGTEVLAPEGEHGALVANMLKAREEGAKRGAPQQEAASDAPLKLNSQQMKEFERRRQDLLKTQETIQELSRAILPLAKAADYAQEDTDQMSKEHVQWRNQVTASHQQLRHIYQRTVVKTNDRMKAKVANLEQEVEQKKAQIRAQYYQNMLLEKRLNSLTASIVS